jgi:hypothetical protein
MSLLPLLSRLGTLSAIIGKTIGAHKKMIARRMKKRHQRLALK